MKSYAKIVFTFQVICLFVSCQIIPQKTLNGTENTPSSAEEMFFMQDDIPFLKKNGTLSKDEYQSLFEEQGISDACFVMHNLKHNAYTYYNAQAADISYSPTSTFDIFNSLLALECAAVADTNTPVKWDGVWRENKNWDQNLDLQKAFSYSAIWFYQEMARRIGEKRMKPFLEKAHYGNVSIKGEIDQFWIKGELKISPREQIDFLEKLYKNDLPFSISNQLKIKNLLIEEKNEKGTLFSHSGSVFFEKKEAAENVGWYIGYVEKPHNQFFFALCLHYKGEGKETEKTFLAARKIIAHKILQKLSVWESE